MFRAFSQGDSNSLSFNSNYRKGEMFKNGIGRYCSSESKDTSSKHRNVGSFLSGKWGQTKLKEGLSDDKAQSTKIQEAKDILRRAIWLTSKKLYWIVFEENGPQVPPKVRFGDMISRYRWLMCNIVHAVISCVIGAVICLLAILLNFVNPSQGTPEILEDISYALLLALTALSISNAIGLYLILPLSDDGYHSSALQLLRKLSELRQDLSYFESSIGIQNEKTSLKRTNKMLTVMGLKLYETLFFGLSAKEDVMKMAGEIKPILEKANLRGEPEKIPVSPSCDEEKILFKQYCEDLQRLLEIRKSRRSRSKWTVW